ncbi:AMP-binding protein [Thioalkalivibrio sp. ALJ7]|uniref:AMP-binding protein n=1 Tax=Thioalkalivibrio sp. ALJ7 TaxID=1158756 RepID=UPI00036287DD|nr:AMP-binding protein [Thioalkalivibrio sp. ALJ7]
MTGTQDHPQDILPLLADTPAPLARIGERTVSRAAFLADVQALAARLPQARAAFNLCQDRYHFAVAFAAILLRRQINLLPPNRGRTTLAEIAGQYPDAPALVDGPDAEIAIPVLRVSACGEAGESAEPIPTIPSDQTAILAFSSGSTGTPTVHARSWGALHAVTHQALECFGLQDGAGPTLVGTVPPQHMYGLESTILYALLGHATLLSQRPFYPEDVRAALAACAPAVLVTTPFHLNACLRAGLEWPQPERILCATAPLDPETAGAAERVFGCRLDEIYGCTEAGAIATRRTTRESDWTTYPGVEIHAKDDGIVQVQGPQHPAAVPLPDHIEARDAHHFRMEGRLADQLNIAGKRASLADLNRRLNAIPGVLDGVFIPPEPSTDARGVTRLAALVVAPGRSEAEIQATLAECLDPLFLPRPLVHVDHLPRSATGKLPRQVLLDLLARHGECA